MSINALLIDQCFQHNLTSFVYMMVKDVTIEYKLNQQRASYAVLLVKRSRNDNPG